MKLTGRSTLLIAAAQVLLAASPSSPQVRDLSDDKSGVRKIRETGDERICDVVVTADIPHLSEEERRAEWGAFEAGVNQHLLEVLAAMGIPVESGDQCEGGTLEMVARIAKDEEGGYFFATMILQYFAHKPARESLGEAEPAWIKARALDATRYKLQEADRDELTQFMTLRMLEINFNLFFEFASDWKEAYETPP